MNNPVNEWKIMQARGKVVGSRTWKVPVGPNQGAEKGKASVSGEFGLRLRQWGVLRLRPGSQGHMRDLHSPAGRHRMEGGHSPQQPVPWQSWDGQAPW